MIVLAFFLPTVPAVTWPAVFDGIGALVVSCALDPEALVTKIDTAQTGTDDGPHLTWIAAKLTGTDTGGDAEVRHCLEVWRSLGLKVGGWIYCDGPPLNDVLAAAYVPTLDFTIFNVETPYKADEGGHYEWAAELVSKHRAIHGQQPAAVTSYGGYKTSIDFGAFARAGWPVFAQVYDAFKPGDESTYYAEPVAHGPYPAAASGGVHRLTRSLRLAPGEAVYRPESIDG